MADSSRIETVQPETRLPALAQEALDFGFSHAALMDPAKLEVREEVRDMCAADRCQSYNRSWSCPPGCGSLDESRQVIAGYRLGLIVQTTGELEDPYDYDAMMAVGADQKRRLTDFREVIQSRYPRILALGHGACTLCEPEDCAYPDAACRHPEATMQSMEAFGLIVTDVCADNDLGYYYGPNTITYTGCYLLE